MPPGVVGAVFPSDGVYSPELASLLAGAMPPALLGTVVAPGVSVWLGKVFRLPVPCLFSSVGYPLCGVP